MGHGAWPCDLHHLAMAISVAALILEGQQGWNVVLIAYTGPVHLTAQEHDSCQQMLFVVI